MQFDQNQNPLVSNWDSRNLLFEILLMEGFPLSSTLQVLPNFPKNEFIQVSHDFCAHRIYICLDDMVSAATVISIAMNPEDTFICLDSAISDEAKLRLSDHCNLKVI